MQQLDSGIKKKVDYISLVKFTDQFKKRFEEFEKFLLTFKVFLKSVPESCLDQDFKEIMGDCDTIYDNLLQLNKSLPYLLMNVSDQILTDQLSQPLTIRRPDGVELKIKSIKDIFNEVGIHYYFMDSQETNCIITLLKSLFMSALDDDSLNEPLVFSKIDEGLGIDNEDLIDLIDRTVTAYNRAEEAFDDAKDFLLSISYECNIIRDENGSPKCYCPVEAIEPGIILLKNLIKYIIIVQSNKGNIKDEEKFSGSMKLIARSTEYFSDAVMNIISRYQGLDKE